MRDLLRRLPAHRSRVAVSWQRAAGRLRLLAHRSGVVPALATITPIGWAVVAICVVAWVAAIWLGWVEMAVVALACLVLLAVAALFTIGRTRIVVTTLVEPPRVTVGEPLTGELRARNDARAPLVSVSLEFPIGDGGITYDLPMLLPGHEHAELFAVPTERRGVIAVGPVRTVRGDPLGLFRREQEWTDVTEVFVHPRVTPLEPFGVGLIRDLEGTTAQSTSMSDLAFHALREYAPGDDLRHIHWRSSARHGQLLVRQFLDTRRSHLVVVADARPTSYASEQEYETAISVAASLLRRGLLDDYDVSFCSGEVTMLRGAGRTALDACSRAEPAGADLVDVAARGSRLAPDASLVVLVSGAYADFVSLRRAGAQFSVDATVAAIRVDSAARPGLRTTADLPLLTVSRLDDLAPVLSKGLR